MQLKVVGTGSQGNCYILENKNEALIIELGCKFEDVKKALNFNLNKVSGCIVTHEHGDHAKYINEAVRCGLNIYATQGTIEATGINSHRLIAINEMQQTSIGSFNVLPFDVKHDAAQPVGFLINHKETGNVLFITDTWYVSHRFDNIHNVIIEANYCNSIINERLKKDSRFLRDRIIQSHMSIDSCVGLLKANDMSKVNNILLIHLSDSNSNEKRFVEKVRDSVAANVVCAKNGMVIQFNRNPF